MTRIHPTSLVDPAARISEQAEIGPWCLVGPHVVLEAGVRLGSHVVVEGNTHIGEDTIVCAFAVLGGKPQSLQSQNDPVEEVRLRIGARNIIREQTTMHVGTRVGRGETRVGDDGLFMVGAHVAHDCIVGNQVVLCNYAQLGGHVEAGDHVIISALAGATQRCRVGAHAFVSAGDKVDGDVIPCGVVRQGHLAGINLVGLKRRNVSREEVTRLRAVYRLLFSSEEGTLAERLDGVEAAYADDGRIMEIVRFIRDSRSLCLPRVRRSEWQ